jgi:dipeptidyl aminopeptidase/acylaminoacyl peptidase
MAKSKPKTPFTAEDLYLHRKVTDAHALPAHKPAVFVVRTPDKESDGYYSHLWCSLDADKPPQQLTFGQWKDQSPRVAPDGKQIAFISAREGVAKPHLLDLTGGEARPVGTFDTAASTIRWMPDCSALLVTANVPVDPDWRGARGKQPPPKRGPKSPEVAWKLPYKMARSRSTASIPRRTARPSRTSARAKGASRTPTTCGPAASTGVTTAGSRPSWTW